MKRWLSFGWAMAASILAVTGIARGEAAPRTIEVTAGEYEFAPELIEAAEGEHLVLKARVTDGKKHGLAIKELGVKAALPRTGEPVSIEVFAARPGTYTIACSVYCGNGHSRMKGRLVVSARK